MKKIITESMTIEDAFKALNRMESLSESIDPTAALKLRKSSDADVIFYGYQYKSCEPVVFDPPEELSYDEFDTRKKTIINSFSKLYNDKPKANRYGYERDVTFYALYKK